MFSIKQLFCPSKPIGMSKDYFDRLEEEIKILREEVRKVQLKLQVRESGLGKLLAQVPPVHNSQIPLKPKRIWLTVEDVNNIESSLLAGWTAKQIQAKYGISYNTVWRIEHGTHPKSKKSVAK